MSDKGADDLKKAVQGSLANYLAAVLQLAGFAFHILGARIFGKYAYGGYIFAWGVVEIANKVGLFGFDKGIMRSVATERARQDREAELRGLATALRSVAVLSVCVTTGLILLSGPLAVWKGEQEFALVLCVLAFLVLPWAGMKVIISATMATGTMRYNLLVRGIAEPILLLISLGIFAVLWRNGGGVAISLAHVTAAGFVLLTAFVLFGKVFPLGPLTRRFLRFRTDWSLLRFSFPVAMAELLNQAIYRVDVIMIGLVLKDPLQVANYGACIMLSGAISSIRYAFDPIVSPIVAEVSVSGDKTRLSQNLKMMIRWVTTLALPLFIAMAVYGDFLLSLWGESYRQAHLTLLILACAHLVNAVFGLHQWPVVMSGRPGLDLFNNGVAFVINLGFNLALIPVWGMPGAAMATLAGNLIFRVMQAIQVWGIFRIHAFSIYWFKLLVAAAIAACVEVGVRWVFPSVTLVSFLSATAAGLASYLLMGVALGLAPEDRAIMSRIQLSRLYSFIKRN
jgi:O-antigen/teichoic acid export membrane protein